MSKENKILKSLYVVADAVYKDFNASLIPNISHDLFIGVRTPILRKIAKDMVKSGEYKDFVSKLPHKYFEENQLHAFVLSYLRDFDSVMCELERFLPYVDNWATCDQMSPYVFAKNTNKLLPHIKKWLKSKHVYTVRFGVLCLMRHFLNNNFDDKYMCMVLKIKSNNYYVNMMRAWYFATAAAKQYDKVLPVFLNKKLDTWTHNRAIQKAIDSYRVSPKNKLELKMLKTIK